MAKLFLVMSVLLGVLVATAAAQAAKTGDMFDDEGIEVQNRPEVPSDRYYGWRTHPDMFPARQPFMRTDKDMFDFVPVPNDPGIEEHFSAHMRAPAPDGPLFKDPNVQEGQ